MSDRDLTPAEARAEVEAFLGPEWNVRAIVPPDLNDRCYMAAFIPCSRAGDFKVRVESPCCPTYRAAVDALKQAWCDAVRPWCLNTMELATDCVVSWESSSGDCWEYQDEFSRKIGAEGIVARVLKEDSK